MKPLDRYTCEQVLRLLDSYVDRELSPRETKQVELHLETCVGCAREAHFERSLLDGLKAKVRSLSVPPSAVRKVEAALKESLDPESSDPEEEDV